MAKAQGNIGSAVKGAKNSFFKTSYSDLGSVMEAVKQPLLDQGISVLQMVGRDELGPYVETILLHESGEYISGMTPIICSKQNDPQSMGSSITYSKRYGLQAATFTPSVDDDGEVAMNRKQPETKPEKPALAPQSPYSEPKEKVVPNLTQAKATLLERLSAVQLTPKRLMLALKDKGIMPEEDKIMDDALVNKVLKRFDEAVTMIMEFENNTQPLP